MHTYKRFRSRSPAGRADGSPHHFIGATCPTLIGFECEFYTKYSRSCGYILHYLQNAALSVDYSAFRIQTTRVPSSAQSKDASLFEGVKRSHSADTANSLCLRLPEGIGGVAEKSARGERRTEGGRKDGRPAARIKPADARRRINQ